MAVSKAISGGYKYKVSFVMPVYNVEEYLEETVESILNQSIGFEENCQIIFINDGSTDGSGELCKLYKDRYPNNVVYIEQNNKGVSAARNVGLTKVEGKYISFLDSDDLLSPDTLKEVYKFFEDNYSKIDIVTIPLEFFESKQGDHPLNYRFDSTRVIYIDREYSSIHLSGGATFVKSSLSGNLLKFDTRLKASEDSKFVTKIILQKMAYGVVKEGRYFYRKRKSRTSATDKTVIGKDYYKDNIKFFHKSIISYCNKEIGHIPKYVQFVLMYNMQWRFKQSKQTVLDYVEQEEYKNSLYSILKYIDDDIILSQRNISIEYKLFILNKKHKKNINNLINHNNNHTYYIGSTELYTYNLRVKTLIEYVRVKENTLYIEGRLWGVWLPGVDFGFWVDSTFYEAEKINRPDKSIYFLDEVVYSGGGFRVKVPLIEKSIIRSGIRDGGGNRFLDYAVTRSSRLLDFDGSPYKVIGDYLLCQPDKKTMYIDRLSIYSRIKKEIKYLLSPRTEVPSHLRPYAAKLLKNRPIYSKTSIYRLIYYITKPLIRKDIWIISDRDDSAGDNGEAFFRYVLKRKDRNTTVYFTINPKSRDYDRLKKYGPVIKRGSIKYKIYFLHAESIISSHADDVVLNAFGESQYWIRDLYGYRFIYLRHGVGVHDMSSWLNKYNKNINTFITSSRQEWNSIIKGNYYYDKETVKLTGLARYDLLLDSSKGRSDRTIAIAPTWRKYLNSDMGHEKIDKFISSNYYKFFNSLINDSVLNDYLEKNGYTGEFYLHPAHSDMASLFSPSKIIKIVKYPYDYKRAINKSALMITDYSSVATDFSYTNKPVIYAQFDKDEFYSDHTYEKGDFSYEEDGFGPVTYNLEDTVDAVIDVIKKDCIIDSVYSARIDKFFAYKDRSNRKRIYENIVSSEEV